MDSQSWLLVHVRYNVSSGTRELWIQGGGETNARGHVYSLNNCHRACPLKCTRAVDHAPRAIYRPHWGSRGVEGSDKHIKGREWKDQMVWNELFKRANESAAGFWYRARHAEGYQLPFHFKKQNFVFRLSIFNAEKYICPSSHGFLEF